MNWHLHELGFLPNNAPCVQLSHNDLQRFDRLGADLPALVAEKRFRSASGDVLAEKLDLDAVLHDLPDLELERLFMLFSYFASSYVHAPGLPAVTRIPSFLAVPFVRLAEKVQRPPILSYASYCLHNWRRARADGPVALGNIELLQNFSLPGHGKEDEDWFILVHVNIEANAGAALNAFANSGSAPLETTLTTVLHSAQEMNRTMARMPEGCRPEVYFRKVRPYIFGFFDFVYEGCFGDQPQTYRGETGAQSSIIPTFMKALGIRHKSSLLTQHLEDMRKYMPRPHRDFIDQTTSLREAVQSSGSKPLRELYNGCLREVIAFRSRHFEYAVNYIEKKVDNPLGTGGTPFIPWLKQLIEETREFFLP